MFRDGFAEGLEAPNDFLDAVVVGAVLVLLAIFFAVGVFLLVAGSQISTGVIDWLAIPEEGDDNAPMVRFEAVFGVVAEHKVLYGFVGDSA